MIIIASLLIWKFHPILMADGEDTLINRLSAILCFTWLIPFVLGLFKGTFELPYGRFSQSGSGQWMSFPAKLGWFIQEVPSFIVPLLVVTLSEDCQKANNFANVFVLGLFLCHYFQRTFIFSLLIKGGKRLPWTTIFFGIGYCALNGYLQTAHLLKYADLGHTPLSYIRMFCGTCIFMSGLLINVHSDHVTRNLRKPGESGYKIPTGGMFDLVSGANYLGEIMEWWGFALLCWSLPALAFAINTTFVIGPRAFHYHRWYKQKFEDYPKDRKALIPFLL